MTSHDPINHMGHKGESPYSELTLRFFSAIIMIAISLLATYLGGWYFGALIYAVAFLMSWEWIALEKNEKQDINFIVLSIILLVSIVLAVQNSFILSSFILILTALIIAITNWVGPFKDQTTAWAGIGLLYIGLPSLAMIWFRTDDGLGLSAVLFLFLLAWMNDSTAYFAGKLIGGVKLWPSVSPGKTWAGFLFGLVGSMVVGLLFSIIHPQSNVTILLFF